MLWQSAFVQIVEYTDDGIYVRLSAYSEVPFAVEYQQ